MPQHLERLDGLAPFLRPPAQQLIQLCEAKLHRLLLVVHGWRSVQEQALLYQQGREMNRETGEWTVSDHGLIITNAKPGCTAHNVIVKRTGEPAAVALDVIPLRIDGSPDWEVDEQFWDGLYELSWKVGLDPLGDAMGAYLRNDKGHFEEPAWKLKLEGLGLMLPSAG